MEEIFKERNEVENGRQAGTTIKKKKKAIKEGGRQNRRWKSEIKDGLKERVKRKHK